MLTFSTLKLAEIRRKHEDEKNDLNLKNTELLSINKSLQIEMKRVTDEMNENQYKVAHSYRESSFVATFCLLNY